MNRETLVGCALVLLWYSSNILVVFSNKYLLSNYGFKYPMFLTACHMVACTFMGFLCSLLRVVPKQSITSRSQMSKVFILACIFCLSVALGNISLKYIPVSFNQAIGATTPFFTAVISLCLLWQFESAYVYLSLVPVVAGVIVASGAEPSFNAIGFTTAIVATANRALKSVLQGILLADKSEKLNSMNLLLYMAPIASLVLVPAILVGESDVLVEVQRHISKDIWFVPMLTLNALLAFVVNLSNFMVTKHTSALTLQVIGNGKGVVATALSVLLFKNPVSIKGLVGYGIAVSGVIVYSQAKRLSRQSGEPRRTTWSGLEYHSREGSMEYDLHVQKPGQHLSPEAFSAEAQRLLLKKPLILQQAMAPV